MALLVLTACGAPTAGAQPAPAKSELERRVVEVARMLQAEPRFKGLSAKQVESGVEFVTGNTLFVLSHEAGHAVIAEMGIPVIGREEDGADAFATVMLLKLGHSFADRVLTNAAKGWFLGDQRDKKDGVQISYYDEHGIDLQRAYSIVCLMVGGEPEKFTGLADEVKIPEERQGTCQGDYSNASWSLDKVLKPHLRAPDQPKTTIAVTYGSGKGEYDHLMELARKLKILEAVAGHLSEAYVWRAPISLEMQTCGQPAAQWEGPAKKLTVCYEVIAQFADLYHRYGNAPLLPIPDKKVLKRR